MRRRFGALRALLVVFAMVLGLTVVSVAQAPQASAFPLTGSHSATFHCVAPGNLPQRLKLEWSMTFTGTRSNGAVNEYSWQLHRATYEGPAMPSPGTISGKVTYQNRPPGSPSSISWLAVTGGGANGPSIFPSGTTSAGAPVVRENGVGGISWGTSTVLQSLSGQYDIDPVIRIVVEHPGTANDCVLIYDLGDPDTAPVGGPTVGSNIVEFECSHPDLGSGAPQRLAVEYVVEDLGEVVNSAGARTHDFSVQITEAAYQGPAIDLLDVSVPESPGGPDQTLRPVDDPATMAAWGAGPLAVPMGVDDFLQTQGVAGVHFPVRRVRMPPGTTGVIEMKTAFFPPIGSTPPACFSYQDITAEGNETLDYTGDLQCTGLPGGDGPLGHLRVQAEWEQNSALSVRLKAYPAGIADPGSGVLLFNDSDYWLRFPGPGPSGQGFMYSVDPANPAPGPFGILLGGFVLPPNTTEYLPIYDAAWDGDNPFKVWSSEDMALSITPDIYDENNEFQCGQGAMTIYSLPI